MEEQIGFIWLSMFILAITYGVVLVTLAFRLK